MDLRGCCTKEIHKRLTHGIKPQEFDIFRCPDKDCPNVVWYVKGKWQHHGVKGKLSGAR